MPALTHKAKVRIAKRLRKQDDLSTPLFETNGWDDRKKTIKNKVKKQQTVAHYQAEERKRLRLEELAKKGKLCGRHGANFCTLPIGKNGHLGKHSFETVEA